MDDVVIIDALNDNLEFLGAEKIDGNGYTLNVDLLPPNQVRLTINQLLADQQAVIALRTRVRNIASAQAGVTFTNTVLYTFVDPNDSSNTVQGGGTDTSGPIRIVEPELSLGKSVVNISHPGLAPRAGDILRYTLAFSAAGGQPGDGYADAFDLRIDDQLGLGLAYHGNPTVSGAGNTIGAPVVTGDGATTAQTLLWRAEEGNAAVDIVEGSTVNVAYDVRVLDSVLADQTLANSATAQWTGISGPNAYERNGTRTPAWNDYFIGPVTTTLTVPDNSAMAKIRVHDTYGPGDADVRIGDILTYELRLSLQEGSHANAVVTDTLPQGLIFEGVASINGDTSAPFTDAAPFVHADIPASAIVAAGDPTAGPTTVTWTLGDIVNVADGNPANDDFVILYRARVLNDAHPHVNALALNNAVRLDHDTAAGPAPPKTAEAAVTARQPHLTVAKTALSAGGDAVVVADEVVTYTVDIANTGDAPAYDTVLTDTLPAGMRNGTATLTPVRIELLSGTVLPILAGLHSGHRRGCLGLRHGDRQPIHHPRRRHPAHCLPGAD
jgi:large repetitive protein